MKYCLISALILTIFISCEKEYPDITGNVKKEEFKSEIVDDTYLILVRTPPDYEKNTDKKYPVVFQLDATSFGPQFDITAGYASEFEKSGEIEEVIVVGIGYPYNDEKAPSADKGRGRDYVSSEGADDFLKFIREELFPYIESKYRVDTGKRVLSGHSLGGFFVLYTMLKTGEEGSPFYGYIAGDPSLAQDDLELLKLDRELSEKTDALPVRLYFLIARYDGAGQRIVFDELTDNLSDHYKDLDMETKVINGDHGEAIIPSFRNGLEFMLGGQE